MTISLAGQTIAFLYSCAFGVALCVVYDLFRAVRLFFLLGRVWTAFLDVLYFFLAAVFTFAFFMAVTQGEVRGYLYLGEFLGWFLYYETVGSWLFRLQNQIFSFLHRVMRKIASPFRKIVRKLSDRAHQLQGERRKSERVGRERKKKIAFRRKNPCNAKRE